MDTEEPQIISLSGEFDIHNVPKLEAVLRPTIQMPRVVVDFSGVRYFDSTAISVLIKIRKARAERGFVPKRFVGLNPSMRHVFKITQLDSIWPLFDDIESACQSF